MQIIVDGTVYDPTNDIAKGIYQRQLINDAASGISVVVQTSRHPVPAEFNPVPPNYYNFLAIRITTNNYVITLQQQYGYELDFVTGTNIGMCGPVGGIWGGLMQSTTLDPTKYVITDPYWTSPEYAWTPTCGATSTKSSPNTARLTN